MGRIAKIKDIEYHPVYIAYHRADGIYMKLTPTRHAKAERYGTTRLWTPIAYAIDFDPEEEVELIEE